MLQMWSKRWMLAVLLAMGLGLVYFLHPAAAKTTDKEPASVTELANDAGSPGVAISSLVLKGELHQAQTRLDQELKNSPNDPALQKLQRWLDHYNKIEKERDALHAQELSRAVDDARQAIKDKKWRDALRYVRLARELTPDKDKLVKEDWVQDLVKSSKEAAESARQKEEWTEAAAIYSHLAGLYQDDATQKKTYEETFKTLAKHARAAEFYKTGEKEWKTVLEGISDKVVRPVLVNISRFYVTKPNFVKMSERALDHLLVLAETKSLQETFPSLKDAPARAEFIAGVKEQLDKVKRVDNPDNFAPADVKDIFETVTALNDRTIKLPAEVVVYEFMEGALSGLDPFSNVIWPSEMQDFKAQTEGEFSGVGIQLEERDKKLVVVTPLDDTPAYKAGVHAEDVIVKVKNESGEFDVSNMSINRAVKLIKGPKRTRVTLTLYRPSEKKEYVFSMLRDTIKPESVRGWQRKGDNKWNYWLDENEKIGYVRVGQFSANTVESLVKVLETLKAEGVRGLILDLRDNPGGLLNAAEEMADLFIDKGPLVSTKGRAMNEEVHSASPGSPFENVPLVVLVNEFSASASEIVSGAIQDTHRGLIVGERTFGKGSVQNLIDIKPDQGYVKLTTAKYYLPKGRCLHRDEDSKVWGVDPDREMKLSPEESVQVFKMRRDNDRLVTHNDNTRLAPLPTSAPATQPFLQLSTDPQMALALMIMRSKLLSHAEWTFAERSGKLPAEAVVK